MGGTAHWKLNSFTTENTEAIQPGSLVSGNDCSLNIAVAIQHVPQHVMQPRERSLAGDVIRDRTFLSVISPNARRTVSGVWWNVAFSVISE